MTGRRVWMVISDENGNPERGYELRNLTDIQFDMEAEHCWDNWGDPLNLRTPLFQRRTFTFTLKCSEFTVHEPTPGGGWQPEQTPAIPEAPRALPPLGVKP